MDDEFGEVTSGFVRIRVQTLFQVTIDTKNWLRNRHFSIHIHGYGMTNQFTAYPDYDLESIEGDSLLMPLAIGERDYPYDYSEMRGLFLDPVADGVYRRKGAWRIGGEYVTSRLNNVHSEMMSSWRLRGEGDIDKATVGLDVKDFASLRDGTAYVVKII